MINPIKKTAIQAASSVITAVKKEIQQIQKPAANALERTPVQDTFVASSPVSRNEAKKLATVSQHQIFTEFEFIKKEKFFSEEILFLLQPKSNTSGAKIFTPNQAKIINMAAKKVTFYKGVAKTLEKMGTETIDRVIKDIKLIFGGEKNYGKYLHAREKNGAASSKDAVSIYNKIIKEFNNKKVETEIMNIFAKRLYQKPYKLLDKTEKDLVKLSILDGDVKLESRDYKIFEKILTTGKKDFEDARSWVKDLIGLRMIIPDNANMETAAEYLTKAILSGKLNVTRVSNYHSNHIYPYISHETVKLWKQSVPGIELVQTKAIRKRNGYTTAQMNILHPVKDKNGKVRYVCVELQLRSEELNKIGQIEHLIYDILAGKNIGKNIPELEQYYESTGIKKAVLEVFNVPRKELAYTDYERAMYSWIRHNENPESKARLSYTRPILTEFGLGEYENVLSFDSLQRIDDTANILKIKYGKKN